LSPHVPLRETSERAAYALLLLHGAWSPSCGEAGLLGDCTTATERYREVRQLDAIGADGGGFPKYVQKSLERRINSETLVANTGVPRSADSSIELLGEEFDNLLADQAEEFSDRPEFMSYSADPETTSAPLPDMHGRVIVNCSISQLSYLGNFVSEMKKRHKLSHVNANICSDEEAYAKIVDPSRVIEIENVDQERAELEARIGDFNLEQRACFDAAQACISGADERQMIMFVSGEGGTGKSFLIHALTKYTQILFGKTAGWFGSVLKTAPTGGASYNIRGHTWHSALGKTTFKRLLKKGKLSDKQVASLQKNVKGVELFILDEISLLSLEDLYEISFRLSTATGTTLSLCCLCEPAF
jgi:hypothetical protein